MHVDEDKNLLSIKSRSAQGSAGIERAQRGFKAENAKPEPGSSTWAETELLQRFFGGKTMSDLYIRLHFSEFFNDDLVL